MTMHTIREGKKTSVVAGGAGFVGSHLCDALLAKGHRVICIDSYLTGRAENIIALENHPEFRMIEADICNIQKIDEPVDQIFNLACAASPPHYQADPIHTMMTCVQGTANLLSIAAQHHASFVQASTSEIYGDPEEHPQQEDYRGNVNCTGPRACYDEGKRAAEALCFDMWRSGQVDVRVARIFNTYGPRMRPDDGRIISNLLVQALKGEALTIYGHGNQTRSFCYVEDLVAGLVGLMKVQPNPGLPVNIGNPGEFTINELAEMVLDITHSCSETVYKPLPLDDPQRRKPDVSRAYALLGWEPTIPLKDGLQMTAEWFASVLPGEQDVRAQTTTTASRLENADVQ